jgi:hypothetical protein
MISKSPPNFSKLGREPAQAPRKSFQGQSLDFLGFHFFVRNETVSIGYRDPLGIKVFLG